MTCTVCVFCHLGKHDTVCVFYVTSTVCVFCHLGKHDMYGLCVLSWVNMTCTVCVFCHLGKHDMSYLRLRKLFGLYSGCIYRQLLSLLGCLQTVTHTVCVFCHFVTSVTWVNMTCTVCVFCHLGKHDMYGLCVLSLG